MALSYRCGRVSDCCSIFFFFQAEDGIRDYKVTGVQTCALPISCCLGINKVPSECATIISAFEASFITVKPFSLSFLVMAFECQRPSDQPCKIAKIGRASCRERV